MICWGTEEEEKLIVGVLEILGSDVFKEAKSQKLETLLQEVTERR